MANNCPSSVHSTLSRFPTNSHHNTTKDTDSELLQSCGHICYLLSCTVAQNGCHTTPIREGEVGGGEEGGGGEPGGEQGGGQGWEEDQIREVEWEGDRDRDRDREGDREGRGTRTGKGKWEEEGDRDREGDREGRGTTRGRGKWEEEGDRDRDQEGEGEVRGGGGPEGEGHREGIIFFTPNSESVIYFLNHGKQLKNMIRFCGKLLKK